MCGVFLLFALFEDGSLTSAPAEVIARCVAYKAGVVERDEKEQDERRLLNLGHTVGHGIEAASHFSVSHGNAVAIGMAIVARASKCLDAERIIACLERFGLPVTTDISVDEISYHALSDKKRSGSTLNLIVPTAIGSCIIHPIAVSDLQFFIEAGL